MIIGNNRKTSKSLNDECTYKNSENPSYEECVSGLIDLNINFWTRLSLNPINEIEEVCDNEDISGLVELCGYSNEELAEFMNLSIFYAEEMNPDVENATCDCTSEVNYSNIIGFVEQIQNEGGPETYFNQFYQITGSDGPDWQIIGECMAACTLTCLPLTWNPPAWSACIAGCTALCYHIETN